MSRIEKDIVVNLHDMLRAIRLETFAMFRDGKLNLNEAVERAYLNKPEFKRQYLDWLVDIGANK